MWGGADASHDIFSFTALEVTERLKRVPDGYREAVALSSIAYLAYHFLEQTIRPEWHDLSGKIER